MSQLRHRLRLDLTDPLSSDVEVLAEFFERLGFVAVKPEPKHEDVSLALGAFDVFRVSTVVIEPLVAVTIILVVAENMLRKEPARQRPWVALAFGVIHGFAFSQTLWELEVLDTVVAPLVGFNLGVELGQLALVVPLFPALAWLRKNKPQPFSRLYLACNVLIGCAALYCFMEEAMAEMACVAIHPDYRNSNRGDQLVAKVAERAKRLGIRRLFVLTTRSIHWFRERGFDPLEVEDLPVERQRLYNWQRRSKVLSKTIV